MSQRAGHAASEKRKKAGLSEKGSFSSESKCHLRVVIFRRVPSARTTRNFIAHIGVPRGSERKNDTCLTPCVAVHGWTLHKCVIFVQVRRDVPRGLPGTNEIACPKIRESPSTITRMNCTSRWTSG